MSKLLRTILTPNLCLIGIVLGVLAFVLATIPLAHAADIPAPHPKVEQKAPPKQPEPKLYYFPKLKQYDPHRDEPIHTRPEVDTTKWA